MDLARRSGVLLHPTALPGGDLGPSAYAFVDWLADAGQSLWQVLPLGPPGWGGSPYASSSAFAGDTSLVSPASCEAPSIDAAWERFEANAGAAERATLAAFQSAQSAWLEEYVLFAVLKAAHGGGAFWECWDERLVRRDPDALAEAALVHADAIRRETYAQFMFDAQWSRLRAYAATRRVRIMGDLPIFVARDSADVWAHPELFELDAEGNPTVVAGVPPDPFCADGQRWGNPLYARAEHERTGYAWWIDRFRRAFEQADVVRLDHFRGFASWYEIQASCETAREGRWVEGPGFALFEAVAKGLGVAAPSDLEVVAEDLGFITPDVEDLLRRTGFPGMKILQFAFYDDDAKHPFKVENHQVGSVVYTGTHDNETTAGWFQGLDDAARARVVARIGDGDVAWGLSELALSSPAFLAVLPAQDLLGLGNAARFNTPGAAEGNWSWRLEPGAFDAALAGRLRAATEAQGRLP